MAKHGEMHKYLYCLVLNARIFLPTSRNKIARISVQPNLVIRYFELTYISLDINHSQFIYQAVMEILNLKPLSEVTSRQYRDYTRAEKMSYVGL